jgi:hypothetical protein
VLAKPPQKEIALPAPATTPPLAAASRPAALLAAAGLVTAVAAVLAAAAPATARPFVIEARGSEKGPGVVRAIGDFRPARNPRLRAAIRAFGDPSATSGGGEICRVRWADLGVRITFQNFGGVDSCEPSGGRAQKAVVAGDRRWRTVKGLRIGNGVAKLRRLYPRARRTSRGFRLAQGILPFGSPRPYAVLGARVADRRVRAFTLFIGAAGD